MIYTSFVSIEYPDPNTSLPRYHRSLIAPNVGVLCSPHLFVIYALLVVYRPFCYVLLNGIYYYNRQHQYAYKIKILISERCQVFFLFVIMKATKTCIIYKCIKAAIYHFEFGRNVQSKTKKIIHTIMYYLSQEKRRMT